MISEKISINKVKIPDAMATEFSPYRYKVCAPTPAAPKVCAKVLTVKIAASGRLILSLKRSNRSPSEKFFLDKIDEYEAGVDNNTASSKEHRKDKNNAKKKYANRRVIYRKYALLQHQANKNE